MRTNLILILFTFFFILDCQSQVYNQEIIYTFSYSIKKDGNKKSGKIYLGCLGKQCPIKEQKQMEIIWTSDKAELAKKNWNTGIIEDTKRIWMHPPRHDVFSILEYSPFPQIHFPIFVNKTWTWELLPGKNWVNEKYNVKASDIFKYKFTILEGSDIKSPISVSKLKCYKVYAKTTNRIKETSFVGLFNDKYGFLKMVFYNIDNSTIEMELINVDNWNKFNFEKQIWESNSWN